MRSPLRSTQRIVSLVPAMVRVRLRFDSTPLHYARQCWFLFDPSSCRVVGDVAHLVAKHFGLTEAEGIQLYMDDFLVPANESVEIIRDNDTIQVKAVASSPQQGGAITTNSSWSVDPSEESPAKRAKQSTSPRPVKMKTSKKNKHKKQKVKKRTEDTSEKQKEDTEVTAFFKNLLKKSSTRTALRASQLQGKNRVKSATAVADKDTTGSLAVRPPGLLKAVTKQSASGALHTKFCSSSDSEPEEQTSAPKVQQTSTPIGGNASTKSTPRSSSNKRPMARTRSGAGRSSFPSVVGGPSDSFTTKSVIYKRASNSMKNDSDSSSSSSSSSSESSLDNKSKKQTPPPKATPSPKPTHPFKATPLPGSTEDAAQKESAPSAHAMASGSNTPEKVPSKENSDKDYTSLPALLGPPRIGDVIAFKVLELSANCTPEFSDYKEATVLAYDVDSKSTKLKLTESTMKQERKRAVERARGKLSLPVEDEQTELECQNEVELSLESMIETKLVS